MKKLIDAICAHSVQTIASLNGDQSCDCSRPPKCDRRQLDTFFLWIKRQLNMFIAGWCSITEITRIQNRVVVFFLCGIPVWKAWDFPRIGLIDAILLRYEIFANICEIFIGYHGIQVWYAIFTHLKWVFFFWDSEMEAKMELLQLMSYNQTNLKVILFFLA